MFSFFFLCFPVLFSLACYCQDTTEEESEDFSGILTVRKIDAELENISCEHRIPSLSSFLFLFLPVLSCRSTTDEESKDFN